MNVLGEVTRSILAHEPLHPLRVGIDGITASGKSTLAEALAKNVAGSGRQVVLTTLDGFHHPRKRRYERGRDSPEGYYYDAYNYAAVVDLLLRPLGPDGSLRYSAACFDLQTDQPLQPELLEAKNDVILIVDGSFALRNELRNFWDVAIYVDVEFAVAEDRAAKRDANAFGSSELARHTTRVRYHGAHRIHQATARPRDSADFVIDNNDLTNPRLTSGDMAFTKTYT